MELLLIFVTAVLVSMVSSVAGFGSGPLMIMVLSSFYDLKVTIALCAVYFVSNGFQKWYLNRSYCNTEMCRLVLPTGFVFCLLGLWGFSHIDVSFLRYAMAFLCFYMVGAHFLHFIPQIREATPTKIRVMAAIWGFCKGLISSGPLRTMMLRSAGLRKQAFVSTGGLISFVVSVTKVAGFSMMGMYQVSHLPVLMVVLLGSLVGINVGKCILDRISLEVSEYLVMGLLLVAGVKFLVG